MQNEEFTINREIAPALHAFIFDFLAFVNLFNAQSPEADCDADAAFTIFDFLCYTNAFNAGC